MKPHGKFRTAAGRRLERTSENSLVRATQDREALAARAYQGPETASVIERGYWVDYCEHQENGTWPALAVKGAARRARGGVPGEA